MATSTARRDHAIVIGASMTGLLAARVLCDHFRRVSVVERDQLHDGFEPRKGVPQGRHVHALLTRGHEILERLFPGLTEDLAKDGAIAADIARDSRWYHFGGYKVRFESGHRGLMMSRQLIEGHVRRRVLALNRVSLLAGCDVLALAASDDRSRVTGVSVQRRGGEAAAEILSADLVVDASGRGSRAGAWLEAIGYPRAPEEEIKIGVGYTSRLYRRRAGDLPDAVCAVVAPTPPRERRMGALFPVEGDRWLVTLAGWLGEHAPADESGFLAFAKGLPAPDIYDVIRRATPVSEFSTYKFPSNLRRHYERLERVPDDYVVIGDALSSFNPIYGQGMSVSALEALVLDDCLRSDSADRAEGNRNARSAGGSLPRRFYRDVAKVIDLPWQAAAGADFSYPEVQGPKAPGTDFINWYVGHVQRAVTRDSRVYAAFLKVMNLIEPPASLLHPRVVWRVLRSRF